MSVTYEKLSENRAKFSFEVDAETFEKGMLAAYRKNVGQINVPGFRKGKAPRRVIENMYGEGVFFEDAFETIFPEVYEAALKEYDVFPVDQPDITLGEIGSGKPLTFSVEVYVRPDVTLGEYKGLEVPTPSYDVDEEKVTAQLDQARERIARWVDVEREVQTGDRAIIDYLGSVDGVPFEGGKAERFSLDIGSGTFIPGFEDQIVGMKVGEERDITVTFPEDYRAEDLAGKEAVFHIVLHEVKNKELPELDDEFAKDVSEFDTLDEYKADIRSKLEKTAREAADNARDNALVRKAAENAQMDIPDAMIENQVNSMLRDMQMRMSMQGIQMEQFLQITGQSIEDLRGQYREEAAQRVRAELTLDAIRKAEGVDATEEEAQEQIAKIAADMGRDLEQFKATLKESDMEYMRDAAVTEKVLQILRDNAKYVDEEVKAEEEKPQEKKPAKKKKADKEKADKEKADNK